MAAASPASIPKFVGERVRRREDPRLILGEANYVDDIHLEGTVSVIFVRSPYAHAKIKSIDVSKALALDGVVCALTGEDVRGKIGTLPCAWPVANLPFHPVLAVDKVRYMGEPIVAVAGRDVYVAQDAAELIEIDYEPLEPVTDPEKAMEPGGPLVHEEFGTNIVQQAEHPSDNIDAVMKEADRIIKFRFVNQRILPLPMETRGVLAKWDGANEELLMWSSTQIPHMVRSYVGEMIGIPENRFRVIAPEVGGGFGAKSNIYNEEAVISYMAMQLKRPVKWIERRREQLATLTHGRGQIAYVEAAVKNDGTVLGLKARLIGDMGAYLHLLTPMMPGLSGMMMPNTYKLKAFSFVQQLAFTNRMATDTYRGAGMPEACSVIERLMDMTAAELGMDPVEVRRKNLVKANEFPFVTVTGLCYDSGDYEKSLDKALELADYKKLRAEQAEARKHGRYIGIGVTSYVEVAGVGPSSFFPGLKVGGWESATVRIETDGKVTVLTGSSPHGQGLETSFAQITADKMGVAVEDVRIVHGDTGRIQYGIGTFASRSMAVGGGALAGAIGKVQDKMKKIASYLMEAPPDQLTFGNRMIMINGDETKSIPMQKVIDAAYQFRTPMPGLEPGLEENFFFEPPNFCAPFGTHIAVVEVDVETGRTKWLRYVIAYDCGTVINPMIVEGQVHGGTTQGIGQAMCEEIYYDESGQLISGSLMDYAVPRAETVPSFEITNTVTPTDTNPLGAKGIGESGCIAGAVCAQSAVIDALAPFGVKNIDLPLKAERVWRAIQDAKKG